MKRFLLYIAFIMATTAGVRAQVREVVITYQGNTASVNISPDIASVVTAAVQGADVSIVQDAAGEK